MVTFGTTFVRHAGYDQWADTNDIVVLYPQATASPRNPNGCWDWWGYDDPDYALKRGRQMAAVKGMVDRITSGFVALPAPTGLTVTGTADTSVGLSWDAVSGAAGFDVYRDGRKVNAAPVIVTSFTDTGLAAGTAYGYAVAALTGDGREGARSVAVSARTTGTPPAVPPPTALEVDGVDASSVSLSWTAAPGVPGYRVLRATRSGGPYATVNQDPVTATTFEDTGVQPGTTYFYVVESVTAAGATSPPTGEVSATTGAAPACFTATNFDHVQAGRAHDELSIARANGSDQIMGLDNVFIVTTLKRTGENFYVIGTCS